MKLKNKQNEIILLIDSANIAYSALYTTGHLSNQNKQTGIIYGFLKQILSLAKRFKTNQFIFCWDAGVTYRHFAYPEYKKQRQKSREADPEKMAAHKSLIKQNHQLIHFILPNLGFKNVCLQQYFEADDLLAYWTKKLKSKKIIMVTSDNDMYQCLNNCDIWLPQKKELFTKELFTKKYKIKVSKWALAKAIGGCSGDNVKGIQGVSDPKNPASKALVYLQGKLKDGKIKSRINSIAGQELIKLNLPLVTTPYRKDKLKRMFFRKNKFNRKTFFKIFDTYRFDSFLTKDGIKKWENAFIDKE